MPCDERAKFSNGSDVVLLCNTEQNLTKKLLYMCNLLGLFLPGKYGRIELTIVTS